MIRTLKKIEGKSSTLFVVVCTMLFCFSVFIFYQINSDRINRNSIEQAEFEAAYDVDSGSAPDYKTRQAEILKAKELETEKQLALKAKWLDQLHLAMQSKEYEQLEQTILDLKQASIEQPYAIQALQEIIDTAVFDFQDTEMVKAIASSGWVGCQLDLRPGKEFLERALNLSNTKPLQTLIDAGCMHFNNRFASETLISHILAADEPRRQDVFKTFASNNSLQTTAIKSLLERGHLQTVVDYISNGILSKDLYIGSSSLLGFSIENQYALLTNYLIENNAVAKGKSYGSEHALVKAINQNDLVLIEKVVNLSASDLNDPKFADIVFRAIKNDIKTQVTKILFNSNPRLINNESIVRGLLLEAVLVTFDFERVEFLLNQGADPNVFVSRKTLLTVALEKSPAVSPEIIESLKKNGAFEDALDVIRQQRGIDKNATCNFSQAAMVEKSVFEKANSLLSQKIKIANKDLTDVTNNQRCETGIVYCKEQGHGVDACMASISSCAAGDKTICCDADIKDKYFKNRCAGMHVTESISWLDAFETIYGVPVNFQ